VQPPSLSDSDTNPTTARCDDTGTARSACKHAVVPAASMGAVVTGNAGTDRVRQKDRGSCWGSGSHPPCEKAAIGVVGIQLVTLCCGKHAGAAWTARESGAERYHSKDLRITVQCPGRCKQSVRTDVGRFY
jgi:hypothetical protein